jgi:alkyl hydroperoxide reductase subunit AhpC
MKGDLAPDFTGTALDGKKVTLSDYRDKNPVVLSYYADFVPTRKQSFTVLKSLDEKYSARGLRVIAVSLDEERQTAANLPSQVKVKFPVIFDPKGAIAEKYAVQALPHTVVIAKDGKVQQVITGLDEEKVNVAVSEVLK